MVRRDLEESKKFVLDYIKENKLKSLKAYGECKEGNVSLAVQHYTLNKLDKFFLAKLISKGIVKLTDNDRMQIPYIIEQWNEILEEMKEDD